MPPPYAADQAPPPSGAITIRRGGGLTPQVVCRLDGGEEQRTAVARGSLDPVFNHRLRFRVDPPANDLAGEAPGPPGPSPGPSTSDSPGPGRAATGLAVEIMHADISEAILGPLCDLCELRRADTGAVLLRGAGGPEQLVVLDSGTVGIFEDEARAAGAAGDDAGGEGHAGMVEVGRVSRRGACFGEVAMMTGRYGGLAAVALAPVAAVCLSADAFGRLLVSSSPCAAGPGGIRGN